ncbi:hypothetical protein C3747_7g1963c [Trypanosoma cruzi]|uniref:Uncharacterized protein n=2 Tax=Trypanosoma cruzi TaxID=5693 RepID=Q4DLP4_TRYCC|nr:hypothetical protein, conserved [Trypanosoma cruzi]XP_816930.1 hypothetical protein, conserved [Trypanosoma cruzi]EAN93446.1 hypothetical protein, conserved [Trypanosoma cruzi]EAN95079.1 hypothetical protein, conserved [Trypanosoma cruzi]KAF8282814.1 hypothetical protein TcYC6_0023730 [Trypanosoma cruzi]KAF8304680.1 hypothetical protein TcBrA4_0046370 [Trypanosoma cruzi]PWU87068.1 hypothetical protein C4B63_102g335c [Trypanosoma cruzi]|eukprot:XP_815297.1 hypothetical protein [Trypanosoma cruzi strain CL Brener]
MWRERWHTCTKAMGILWTVGGRLRTVYNGSKSEEERRKDRYATFIRLTVFALAFAAFVTVDSYGDPAEAVAGVTRGIRRLLRGR